MSESRFVDTAVHGADIKRHGTDDAAGGAVRPDPRPKIAAGGTNPSESAFSAGGQGIIFLPLKLNVPTN